MPLWSPPFSNQNMMVVIASGSGHAHQLVEISTGFPIITYTDTNDMLWSSEILQVTKHLEEHGVCPHTISKKEGGTRQGQPQRRQIANLSLTFNDDSGLEDFIGRSLGLYEAKPGTGALIPLALPQSWSNNTTVEMVTKHAMDQGYSGVVVLCCKGDDPNIQVLGRHIVAGSAGCHTASMRLSVGKSYPDLQKERLLCETCHEPFLPTKMQFSQCRFKLAGTERPSGSPISFPGVLTRGWCTDPYSQLVEVDYPRSGVMSLMLETSK